MARKAIALILLVFLVLSSMTTAFAVENEESHVQDEPHIHDETEPHTHGEDEAEVATPSDIPPPEFTVLETRNGMGYGIFGPPLESPKPGISPMLVGSRPCCFNGCTSYVVVTGKHSFVCAAHKCRIAGCPWVYYSTDNYLCQTHAGRSQVTCQVYLNGGLCGLPSVGQGSPTCWEHHCPGCYGMGNGGATLCDLCLQCWVPGCPRPSVCTNECAEHCPHTCKIHHQNHCLDCHTDPCSCLPVNPTIIVKPWNSTDNSVAVDISSTRATQIELYTAVGVKFATLNGASGTHVFRYNAPQNNGSYYVRVKNAKGYNAGSFPFQVTTLDVAAPIITGKAVQPDNSVWAATKTLTVTATDKTNATFSLRYSDGSTVPGCPDKAGTASGSAFTTSWTLTEQLASAKTFKIIAADRWGYSSETTVTISGIDSRKPTKPTVSLPSGGDWRREAVSLTISGSSADSGIARYEYRVDSGAWQTGSTVVVSTEGIHMVEAKAISNAGLESDAATATVKIDLTKPAATYTLSPAAWTTDRVTISLNPTDMGGSGLASVLLPDGRTVYDFSNIQFPVVQNGNYDFKIFDAAGNSAVVSVPVTNIAVLDVTATLHVPFVINPNDGTLQAGNISFKNNSNVPITLTMQNMTATGNAPELVSRNTKPWASLTASETKRFLALGFVGNGVDVWADGQPHSLGVIAKGSTANFAMQGRFGLAWEQAQTFLYGMTVKVSFAG